MCGSFACPTPLSLRPQGEKSRSGLRASHSHAGGEDPLEVPCKSHPNLPRRYLLPDDLSIWEDATVDARPSSVTPLAIWALGGPLCGW